MTLLLSTQVFVDAAIPAVCLCFCIRLDFSESRGKLKVTQRLSSFLMEASGHCCI